MDRELYPYRHGPVGRIGGMLLHDRNPARLVAVSAVLSRVGAGFEARLGGMVTRPGDGQTMCPWGLEETFGTARAAWAAAYRSMRIAAREIPC